MSLTLPRSDTSRFPEIMPYAVAALLVWLPLEDLVRKTFASPLLVYAVKDALILLACLPILTRRGPSLPPALPWILAWGALLHALGSLNPRLPNPLVPLNGMHMTFFAMPLLPVGVVLARRESVVLKLLWVLALGGVLVALVGLTQSLVDPGFLNPEDPAGMQLRMVRRDVQYVASTFLSPGRYIAFLLNGCAAAMTLSLCEIRPRWRRGALIAVLVSLAGLLTSGARVVLLTVPFLLVTAWLLAAISHGRMVRQGGRLSVPQSVNPRRLLALAVSVLLIASVTAATSPRIAGIFGFYWEDLFAERGEMLKGRVELNLGLGNFDGWTLVAGNGTGSASMGLQYVAPAGSLPWVEGGFTSVTWELGCLGLVFYVLLAGSLSAIFLRQRGRGGSLLVNALSAALGPLVVFELWFLNILGPVLQQYTAAIPLWLFSGIMWGLADASGEGSR